MPRDPVPAGPLSRNERLILSLIRRQGPMPRAALAPLTGLSAQAITNLTRKLMQGGYLDAGAVVRGKVGQPSVPLALAPDGAWFLGLKIGRRLAELALVDFTGEVRAHRQQVHAHPDPGCILDFTRRGLEDLTTPLSPDQRARIAGLGIAAPYRLWDWGREMAGWRDIDLRARLAGDLPYPVFLDNDATTACGAQQIFGALDLPRDFIHVYIAHFAGGGIVLDGVLRHGPRMNAGALGSMPIPGGGQLLDRASVSALERRIGHPLPPDDAGWDVPLAIEEDWAEQAGQALAFTALSAVALVDLPLVVIDGAVPPATRTRLTDATRRAMAGLPAAGIDRPEVIEGSLGRRARILGAAGLPLAHFFQPEGLPLRGDGP
ncbi:ROK family transcriptional regulator [Paracoccus gahaiensis]|uniref:ROK family transcriptional regulator n=1 Tax=Paracoccus gahaiensis TaxID=1706839 RepID=A0A4V5MVA9_9RHOB|nr:ROK family transcriptional regulator [Paracoccus gahaiensis]TJZ91528.1 ROK family transcriptional regulator [Paracoccus gahaiensis]